MAIRRPTTVMASRISVLSSDSVRNPCAMVAPNGDSAARAPGSTWIH